MPCDLMIVGEAPGAREEQLGRPFVGDSGWILNNDFLASVGVPREQVRITNACRCRPPDNRTPTAVEIAKCRKYLVAEIQACKPKVVLLLGATALESALQITGIQKHRGHLLRHAEFGETIFVPTFHPSAVLRNWEKQVVVKADFAKAVGVLRGEVPMPSLGTYYTLRTVEDVREIMKYLHKCPRVAFDIETTSLRYDEGHILCFSFSAQEGTAYTIPLWGQYNESVWGATDFIEVCDLIEKFLASDVLKVAQNGNFDIGFCETMKMPVKNFWFDTMLAHHLVDENTFHDLDTLISLYTSMPLYSAANDEAFKAGKKRLVEAKKTLKANPEDATAKQIVDTGESYALIDTDILWNYAAADADATFRVMQVLEKRLEMENLTKVFHSITMPMCKVTRTLNKNGCLVDLQALDVAQQDITKRIDVAEKEVFTELGREFNLRSSKQLKEVLVDDLKWPVVKQTKPTKTKPQGNASFDEEAMEKYAALHYKAAQKILVFRGLEKQRSTYLAGREGDSGILKNVHADGRIHATYKLHGTRTGRLSATEPPMHNIPRVPALLRQIYIPPEGWWWVELDYSQIELRILMIISDEPQLWKWYAEGKDVHLMVAAEAMGIPAEQVTKEQRTAVGKMINFGLVYGKTAYSLAEDMNVSQREAQTFIDKYFERLPKVKDYFDETYEMIYAQGMLVNAFGRRRHLHGAPFFSRERIAIMTAAGQNERMLNAKRAEIERQAVNFRIQSAASDIINSACIRIDKRLEEGLYRATYNHHHHDALHMHIPPEELLEVVRMVKQEMETAVPELANYSFPVDVSVCDSWYKENEEATEWLRTNLSLVA